MSSALFWFLRGLWHIANEEYKQRQTPTTVIDDPAPPYKATIKEEINYIILKLVLVGGTLALICLAVLWVLGFFDGPPPPSIEMYEPDS